MKRNCSVGGILGGLFILTILIIVYAHIADAGTAGGTAPAVGKVNVPATVAKPAKSACTTIGASRAGYATIDVSGTTMINWNAKSAVSATSAGTAEVVKRKWNSNSVGLASSGEYNVPVGSSVSSAKFERYSGNSTLTICTELN